MSMTKEEMKESLREFAPVVKRLRGTPVTEEEIEQRAREYIETRGKRLKMDSEEPE